MTKEKLVRELIRRKYPNEKVFYNYRPEWLINPKTGHKLELDIYYPDLKWAIEIQGIHHNTIYQAYKDEVKSRACYNRGIKLEEIWIKKKSLLKFIEKHGLRTSGFKHNIKWFSSGSPRKNSKMHKYYWNTVKQIKKQGMSGREYRHCARIQSKETEYNRRALERAKEQ